MPLKEDDAYPANPQDAYGWEKLIAERLCLYYAGEFGMQTRIVRFHNIYGPYGTYDGGREKVPAALCRKVAMAEPGGEIEIWGDGEQTRSFCYVDDCVEGIYRLMRSECREPLNLGTEDMVTVNTSPRSSSTLRARTASRCVTSPVPKVSGAETLTTDSSGRCWGGSRRSPSARDSSPPIAG